MLVKLPTLDGPSFSKMYFNMIVFMFVLIVGGHKVFSICDQSFSRPSGVIATGNTSMSTCYYRIRTAANTYLRLKWRTFHVDGTMPYCYDASVVIKTGCSNPRKVAEFCSRNMKSLPHEIYSPDRCITIIYTNNGKSKGFSAQYIASSFRERTTRQCSSMFGGTLMAQSSGIIASPDWPRPSHMTRSSCLWNINTQDSGKRITFNVMDMDLEDSSAYCGRSGRNYVKVKGEKSMTTKSKKIWMMCSNNRASSRIKNTEYYRITVQMMIRNTYRFSRRGFIIGYVTYEDATARAMTKWVMIVGGTGALFLFLLFLFCCYRRRQRRRLNEQQPLVIHPGATVIQPQPAGPYSTQQPAASYPAQPPAAMYPAQQPFAPPVNSAMPSAYPSTVPYGYPDKPPPYAPPPYSGLQDAPGYPPVQPYPPAYPPAYPAPANPPPH